MAAPADPAFKSFVNDPADIVLEMIEGSLLANPGVARLDGFPGIRVSVRSDWDKETTSKVALISGGGSGHEPAHAGYVGSGMLTAAVAGDVYASPSVAAVLAAIRAVGGKPGVLLIVKNYTGDRLNFGLAAEQAKAEGIAVTVVFVGDDCALETGKITGRRGIAGTVLVHKMAGAAAEQGMSLEEVTKIAQGTADAVGSVGVALTVCSVPGQVRSDRLDGPGIEIGLGIHGEPGTRKSPLLSSDELSDIMVDMVLKVREPVWSGSKQVVALINNLGGATPMEVALVARRAHATLVAKGYEVVRLYQGAFMTALDMRGVSVSVLPVDGDGLARLDLQVATVGWPVYAAVPDPRKTCAVKPLPKGPGEEGKVDVGATEEMSAAGKALVAAVNGAVAAAVEAEVKLSELDAAVGDGDCGSTLKRGALAVKAAVDAASADGKTGGAHMNLNNPASFFKGIGDAIRANMGGTSGVLYDIMCRAAEDSMLKAEEPGSPASWAASLDAATKAVMYYGNAKPGFSTMVDALVPASEAAVKAAAAGGSGTEVMKATAEAAMKGAEATGSMESAAGRASYVSADLSTSVIDAGALAVATLLGGASS